MDKRADTDCHELHVGKLIKPVSFVWCNRMYTIFDMTLGERRCLVDVKGWLELDGKVMAEAEVIMYRIAA